MPIENKTAAVKAKTYRGIIFSFRSLFLAAASASLRAGASATAAGKISRQKQEIKAKTNIAGY